MTAAMVIPYFRYHTRDTINKKIIDKLDIIKIKIFCSVKDNIKRIGR